MKNIDLGEIHYLGADIVDHIIESNIEKYQTKNTKFIKLDLISDPLPRADLILCRDCLVHFSFEDAFRALDNICASEAKYILTTSFPERMENKEITTGQWRPINLESPPFYFPPPNFQLIENCTEANGIYKDKSLNLWKISEIKNIPKNPLNQ